MIRVALIAEFAIFRDGLKFVLETGDDISVIIEAENINDVVDELSREQPDLILMELDANYRAVVTMIDAALDACPDSRVLMVSNDHDETAHGAAILAGAHGVIAKDKHSDVLRTAVRKVFEGEAWIDRMLTSKILAGVRQHEREIREEQMQLDRLTPKELEIIKLIATGLVNKEIGNRLEISEKTVRNHLTVIYSKLHVANRLELAIFASHNGIS